LARSRARVETVLRLVRLHHAGCDGRPHAGVRPVRELTMYRERPPSNRKGARIAWDVLSECAAPLTIVELWYASSMKPCPWCAELSDGSYIDLDELELQDRVNNPHKYPGERWNTKHPKATP
jgi:hypothetical protein